mgnify:FL=1
MDEERLRAQESYEKMLTEALILSDKAAAEHGIGTIFEDLIDSIWVSIPTEKRTKILIPTPTGYRSAQLEYQAASRHIPPDLNPYVNTIVPEHMAINRERRLMKKSIVIDTLAKMGLVYRETPSDRMMEESDVD